MRGLSAACSALLVAGALVVAPFFTGPAAAAELLQDGGFEAATGNPAFSPNWTEADSIDGTPLCLPSSCNSSSSVSPPRTGSGWARFGADASASHTASLSQTVFIPTGTATLTYWYRNGQVATPFTATLDVKIDGTTLRTHTEASTAQSSYSQQTINVSAYANGANHTLSFVYANKATGENRMTVDDVSINHTAPPVTATPTVTSTTPASPGSSTTPLVKGTAESGSTVTLYSNNTCTSSLGSGSAATFTGSGITATVPANATTTIYAKATKSGQTDSACSSTSVSYTNDTNAPGLPTVSGVTPASPGSSTTPAVQGTAEAGSTVRLYTTASCTGSPVATGTAAAFASPGLTATVAAGSTSTFKATATDAAGNASGCSTTSVTYVNDSTAPGQVTLTSVTPASPNPSTSPVIQGTAEAGSTVKLYTTSGCTGTPAATGTAAAFGSPGFTVTVAAGSTTTFKATATDTAGNTSACSTSSITYVSDGTAPALVTLTSVTPASPNPSTSPVVKGTAEAGSTVKLYTTADCSGTPAATGTAAAFGSTGFTVTVAAGSTTTFKATATDGAANTSACSTSSITYVNDSTAPGQVTLTSVTPASPNPSTSPVVKGTAEAGSTVKLYPTADCSGTPAATGTAAAFAAPGLTVTVAANSTTTFKGTATDAAGNVSPCSTSFLTYVSDATAPALPTLTSVTPASPNPSTAPAVKGTAEAGSTVKLYTTAACTGTPAATGTAAAFASPGLTATVVVGTSTTFKATATDAAGNTSACSSSSQTYVSDLIDGGFEAANTFADDPYWDEADSLAGSPLCTMTTCDGTGVTAPRTGTAWAWFGGFANAGHTGSVSQALTIPAGTLSLNFWYRNGTVSAPFDAQLLVKVDGTTVKTLIEAPVADDAYILQIADLAAYADGGTHTLSFNYTNGAAGLNNMVVDDIGLSALPATVTAMPTVTTVVPAGPSISTTPTVTGTAEAGSTVTLYSNSACTSVALGTGSAAAFAGAGITATVPVNTTTTIYAKAAKAAQRDSACSATSVSYTQKNPPTVPDTLLTSKPKKKVLTLKRKTRVAFAFASTVPGATYQCSIDGKAFAPCTSGDKLKVKLGKHTFAVRAVASGLTDPTPATYRFKVRRRD